MMPRVNEAEQNPWLSSTSEDEDFPPVHPKLGVGSSDDQESCDAVVLEISSPSPSSHPKGKDKEGRKDGRGTSHSSPLRSHSNTPRPHNSGVPSVVNGGESSYAYGTRSHAHISQSFAVRDSPSPVAAVSRLKRRSSSESLSPALTEEGGNDEDEDEDGTERKGPVRGPPCFHVSVQQLCVIRVALCAIILLLSANLDAGHV